MMTLSAARRGLSVIMLNFAECNSSPTKGLIIGLTRVFGAPGERGPIESPHAQRLSHEFYSISPMFS